jgi:phosphinothricin acetyltransferase
MNINNQNINLRIALKSDWQTIIDIYNQAVLELGKTADTEPQSVKGRFSWLEQHLNPKYPILLAETNTEITGWCSLSPHRPGRKALEKTAEISYYIDRDYRKKGIAKLLINSIIEKAEEREIKNLFAILLDINTPSINLLEKMGFEKWGHLPKVAEVDGQICGQFIYGKHI